MKIEGKKLIKVTAEDLIDGVFENHEIDEIGDGCFFEMHSLKAVIAPKVKQTGSDCLSWNDALTEISLPALQQTGSYCLSWNDALTEISLPALQQTGSDCLRWNAALASIAICEGKMTVKDVDSYCYVIEGKRSRKGVTIHKGYNLLSVEDGEMIKEAAYVAEKDGFTAHGDTIKKAVADLNFKIAAEKMKHDPMTMDTEVTVARYRAITGACDLGVKSWLNDNGIAYKVDENGNAKEISPMPVKEVLPLLEKSGAYGIDRFKELIKN